MRIWHANILKPMGTDIRLRAVIRTLTDNKPSVGDLIHVGDGYGTVYYVSVDEVEQGCYIVEYSEQDSNRIHYASAGTTLCGRILVDHPRLRVTTNMRESDCKICRSNKWFYPAS